MRISYQRTLIHSDGVLAGFYSKVHTDYESEIPTGLPRTHVEDVELRSQRQLRPRSCKLRFAR